ncbi:hypothetical protein K491DRAFT_758764 [Lophiostoma macrostomum CBS 122681]|uniref:BZIP domain-containing protein n=1 Tax=Lophiostoma macrostomum CBS 122681 TaxID=1314788 RepID=A0A6A6T432_9PLEO|nr:hypothetical protein K491DRAFT_758764 [Lophiostoma macrostomum CBS 122681]
MVESTSDGRKKRKITESRRQQGREAQKRYRENKKRRVRSLANTSSAAPGSSQEVSHNGLLPETPTSIDVATEAPVWVEQELLLQETLTSLTDANTFMAQNGMAKTPWDDIDTHLTSRVSCESLIPRDSFIRIHGYCYIKACIENAISMGYDFSIARASPDNGDCLRSVWHQSTAPYLNSAPHVLTVASQTPDLAPSANQLQYTHDLYIDCLPFPDLREKIMALRAVTPKVFDEYDFKCDIHFHEAFKCWGPTPWEKRSWEVQAWFLKKWWMITGGEYGELGNLSRWWRILRGQAA